MHFQLSLTKAFALVTLLLSTFLQTSTADHLDISYCYCKSPPPAYLYLAPYKIQRTWVRALKYHSNRLNKDYTHDFTCGPYWDFEETAQWPVEHQDGDDHCKETRRELQYVFDDGVNVMYWPGGYKYDHSKRRALPGWTLGIEMGSKNKKTEVQMDCTETCRRVFPDVAGITGACNHTDVPPADGGVGVGEGEVRVKDPAAGHRCKEVHYLHLKKL